MKIEHIVHNDKKIVVINWFECKNQDEMIQLLKDVNIEFRRSGENILTLEDYTNIFVSNKFMMAAKKLGKEVLAKKRAKGAILGITGVKKVLLNSYNHFTEDKLIPFNTKQEALDYLVS